MDILDTKCTFKGYRIFLEGPAIRVNQFAECMKDVIDERNTRPFGRTIKSLNAVKEACDIWNVPTGDQHQFKRAVHGAAPGKNFFAKILLKPHYRKALIQCLKEMKF